MITEDYVSFEVAQLLKEKGFNEVVHAYHNIFDKVNLDFNVSGDAPHLQIPCPTHQMAMKWLREDKKILISIFCHIDKGYWFCIQHFIDSPYKFATSESIHRKEEILGKIQYYDTYEQACETAIKYCLENLI